MASTKHCYDGSTGTRHDRMNWAPVVKRLRRDRRADPQLAEFNSFVQTLQWVDYDRPLWLAAAELWAEQRRRGRTHEDADLLIAAFTRRLRAATPAAASPRRTDRPLRRWTVCVLSSREVRGPEVRITAPRSYYYCVTNYGSPPCPHARHGRPRAKAQASRRYIVAMDSGTCRSGRTGSAPRGETSG